jgi:hypothetical protein
LSLGEITASPRFPHECAERRDIALNVENCEGFRRIKDFFHVFAAQERRLPFGASLQKLIFIDQIAGSLRLLSVISFYWSHREVLHFHLMITVQRVRRRTAGWAENPPSLFFLAGTARRRFEQLTFEINEHRLTVKMSVRALLDPHECAAAGQITAVSIR